MKNRIHALVLATSLACVCAFPSIVAADASGGGTGDLNQNIAEQKHVKAETQRVAGELNALILEFDRNGIGDGADVQILKNIRAVLETLSQKDMEKVITLLDNARKDDPHGETRALANVFSAQTGISIQLRQLLIEYQHEQDLADISLQLLRLSDTENENMKAGTGLFRATKGTPIGPHDDVERAQLQVQRSQQQAIHDEAKVLLDRLTQLAAKADPSTAARLTAVVTAAQQRKVDMTLAGAADDLKDAHLLSAVGKERNARDTLRDLARLVAPTQDPETALKDARDNVDKAIREEQFIAKQSAAINAPDKADGDVVAQLDDRHSDNVDATDNVKKDIANLTPEAVPDLKNAENKMQQSRQALTQGKGQDAAAKADAATKDLTAARAKLSAEIARLDDAAKADTKIAAAKALQAQIVELQKREELLQTDTGNTKDSAALKGLAPRQTALDQNLQDLQKQAATDFPDVATTLGDAGKAMEQTQDTLANHPSGPPAVREEQVAIDNLKKAEKQLDDTIAKLEAIKANLAQAQKARDKVAKAADDQAKAEQATNKAAQQDPKKPDPAAPTPQALAAQQQKVADDVNAAKADVAAAAPEASAPLADASKNADAAASALKTPDPKSADPQAKDALKNLQKTLTAIDKQIAADKTALGEPPDDADKLADAAAAVDDALTKLDQPDDPMKAMQAQQQQVAKDLKNMPATPDTAAAQKAADNAAQDLANSDLPKAAQDMAAAQTNMQKAMANAPAKPDAAKPDAGKPDPAKLAATSQKQADLQKQVAAMQAGAPDPTDAAAAELAQAGTDDAGALPQSAADAMAEGQSQSSNAAAQQAAGKDPAAAKAAAKAALTQAKAQIASAQAGAAGEAMGGPPGAPGEGPPMPGQGGPTPGPGMEDSMSKGMGNRTDANVSADSKTGGRAVAGQSAYVGLPRRDRDAIQQSHGAKYPEEYGAMIEQYLKNVSDQTSK